MKKILGTLFIIFIMGFSLAETWEYAKFSTFTVGSTLRAGWTSPEERLFVDGGILPLAEKAMGTLISDTDDALIVWLNHLGSQGWELFVINETVLGAKEYLLKRRVD